MCLCIKTASGEETMEVASVLADFIPRGFFIAMEGDLGAGKTTFTQGMARGLGVCRRVTSPTFNLIQIYDDGKIPLYHVDAYRLESSEEGFEIGLEEYIDAEGLCLVEWAQNVTSLFPEDYLQVRMVKLENEVRRLEFEAFGLRSQEVLRSFAEKIPGNISCEEKY